MRDGRSILTAVDDPELYQNEQRYFVSKLLLQLLVRRLIPALPDIVIASVNPGMCMTNLGRNVQFPTLNELWELLPEIPSLLFMRGAGRGATLVTSATRATESAEYWHVAKPAAAPSVFMAEMTGMKASKLYFDEVMALCEKLSPGSTSVLQAPQW